MLDERRLINMSSGELATVDPVVMNLTIARGIPELQHLEIPRYQRMIDSWATDIRKRLTVHEKEFRKCPGDWGHCIHLFRLGVVANYIDVDLGVKYREDHAEAQQAGNMDVFYTDPGDLFLHKVMDTRRGTCGNMAMLHMVLGRRLAWPVSLTRVWSHFLLRFDNGSVVWNVEASDTGRGGFSCRPDAYVINLYKLDQADIRSGSDLSWLTPRQMLGCFLDLRGRYYNNIGKDAESLADHERALECFPQSRYIRRNIQGARWNLRPGIKTNVAMVGAGF